MPVLCCAGSLPGQADAPSTNAKSENQLNALPFARGTILNATFVVRWPQPCHAHVCWRYCHGAGEVLQSIDMNQDLAFEDALKMRWFLEEFQFDQGQFHYDHFWDPLSPGPVRAPFGWLPSTLLWRVAKPD